MSVWSKDNITPVGLNGNDNFGTIIVASRTPAATPISLNGTIAQICNQNPTQTHCYGGGTLTSGISYIHAYSTSGGGTAGAPLIRDVSLGGGCSDDLSRPYFNLRAAARSESPRPSTSAQERPTPRLPVAVGRRVCGGRRDRREAPSTWSGGVWTGSFTSRPSESGANYIDLSWSTDTNGGCNGANNGSGTFQRRRQAVSSRTKPRGPVQYLTSRRHTGGGLANSMSQGFERQPGRRRRLHAAAA